MRADAGEAGRHLHGVGSGVGGVGVTLGLVTRGEGHSCIPQNGSAVSFVGRISLCS